MLACFELEIAPYAALAGGDRAAAVRDEVNAREITMSRLS